MVPSATTFLQVARQHLVTKHFEITIMSVIMTNISIDFFSSSFSSECKYKVTLRKAQFGHHRNDLLFSFDQN